MTHPGPRYVLAVCAGNICRSPTAEAALREAAAQTGLDIEVSSAGTGGWHVGDPPDPRMAEAAAEDGLHLDGTAHQVTPEDIEAADLVLVMDRSNLAHCERLAAQVGAGTPIRLFREFDPAASGGPDVPDPYYGGPDGFREVVEICRRTAAGVVEHLAGGPDEVPR